MKSNKEIVGLRIISVADGTQIGTVRDYVLNPQGGTLDFFVVDQPSDYLGAKVIAFGDILGLGEFALTVPSPQVIQDVAQNQTVRELLRQDVRIIGTKVLTKKGQLNGQVEEILFDEESGKITCCLCANASGERQEIDAKQVITFGKELLIVEDGLVPAARLAAPQASPVPASQVAAEEPETGAEMGFNLFEQRQIQYFVGKAVDKDIVLDNGDILVAGQPMTEETVSKITSRATLMEITAHLSRG